MIKKFEEILPKIHPKSYIAEGGQAIGAIEMKEFSSIWHNVTERKVYNEMK